MKELFEKVYIKTEADLPEEGLYYASYNDKIIYMWSRPKDWNIKDWLDNVNWYLRPVEQKPDCYPKEFVEWKDDECTRMYNPWDHNQRLWTINDSDGEKLYSPDELLIYWLSNIKDK